MLSGESLCRPERLEHACKDREEFQEEQHANRHTHQAQYRKTAHKPRDAKTCKYQAYKHHDTIAHKHHALKKSNMSAGFLFRR